MSVRFEISPVDDGYCQFHLIDSNGEALLIGAEYETPALAEQAIQDVRTSSLMSQFIAKGKTRDGDFFFLIRDNRGEVIAKSGLFSNEMVFDNALHQVRDKACVAEITYAAGIS